MAYQVSAIAANTEIPALVRSFAASLGFTTGGTTDATVKHPTYTGAKTFTVSTNNVGSAQTRQERIQVTSDAPGAIVAWAESPKLNPTLGNNAAAVITVQPTKLHLFGALGGGASDSGRSFIAGVIEYGFNLYRHFYLGYIEKITAFDGGEVHTGSSFWPTTRNNASGALVSMTYDDNGIGHNAYPFSAYTNAGLTTITNGGVYINHVNNAVPFRRFYIGNSLNSSTLTGCLSAEGANCVIGGFKDSVNGGYAAAAKSPYSGTQILAPVNLYIGKRVSGTQYFQPIGYPAGVRLVHMEDLEPGSEISIGASVWRVFPVFAKSSSAAATAGPGPTTGFCFPVANTSHMIGMAYQVSE